MQTEEYNVGKAAVSHLYLFILGRVSPVPPEQVRDREDLGNFQIGGQRMERVGNFTGYLGIPVPRAFRNITWHSDTWHRLKLEATFPAKTVQVSWMTLLL